MQSWQTRPLDGGYAALFIDALVVNIHRRPGRQPVYIRRDRGDPGLSLVRYVAWFGRSRSSAQRPERAGTRRRDRADQAVVARRIRRGPSAARAGRRWGAPNAIGLPGRSGTQADESARSGRARRSRGRYCPRMSPGISHRTRNRIPLVMRHHQSATAMKRAPVGSDAPATAQRADNNQSAPSVATSQQNVVPIWSGPDDWPPGAAHNPGVEHN